MTATTPAATAQAVLDQLNQALARRDFAGASQLFAEESFWRDLVLLTWNLKTLEGVAEVVKFIETRGMLQKPAPAVG